jgi:hypothetical protein
MGGVHFTLEVTCYLQLSPCLTLTQYNKSSLYLCNSKMINLKPSSYFISMESTNYFIIGSNLHSVSHCIHVLPS